MEFVQLAVLVFFFTIVCIISGVSEEETPEEEFMVMEIEGVSQNGHMSVGDRMPGYLCFIRKDASADRFLLGTRTRALSRQPLKSSRNVWAAQARGGSTLFGLGFAKLEASD
jgi:hypothetical protein